MGDLKNNNGYYEKVPISDNDETGYKYDEPLPKWGVRHTQMLLVLFSMTIIIISRGQVGVTLVAMLDPSHVPKNVTFDNITNANETSLHVNVTDDAQNGSEGFNETGMPDLKEDVRGIYRTYKWEKTRQEMILSAFFFGYLLMMFPMGLVIQRWGGKLPLQIALFSSGFFSIITPWCALWFDWVGVCACRVIMGMSQTGLFPSLINIISHWVPVSERGTVGSYVFLGSPLGTVIAFQMSGFLSSSSWGWPSAFWATGLLCLASGIILTVLGRKSPIVHEGISEEEKRYISGNAKIDTKTRTVPWKKVFATKPMWSCIAAHSINAVCFVFFFNQVPSYLHFILKVNVRESGIYSSLPYIGNIFTALAIGAFGDYVLNNKILSVKTLRILCNSISTLGLSGSLVLVSFTQSTVLAVALLVLAMSCQAASHIGPMMNYIDMAPNFGGPLLSMSQTIAMVVQQSIPVLISLIVTDERAISQWRIIMGLIAVVGALSAIQYVVFGSAEIQPFNQEPDKDECEEDQIKEVCTFDAIKSEKENEKENARSENEMNEKEDGRSENEMK